MPPLNVINNDNERVTIVARGENVMSGEDEEMITVLDDNGNQYLVGVIDTDTVLCADGYQATSWLSSGLLPINCCSVDSPTPNGNWLLLKWLRDNYKIDMSKLEIVYMDDGNYVTDSHNIICQSPYLVNRGGVNDYSFFNEEGLGEFVGYLGCDKTWIDSETPQGTQVLTVEDVNFLSSNYLNMRCFAYTTLMLALNNHINYDL